MRDLQPGDNILYLFDRERLTDADLEKISNDALKRMASAWLQNYTHRFFVTVARNYQPIPGTSLNTFDSHDDSVLFLDKARLLERLPQLSGFAGGFMWVMIVTEDVEAAVRAALAPA